tara:strand:- start:125 stop:481 length:357 start_codon:yes stop_codon:yes gene_type:complete
MKKILVLIITIFSIQLTLSQVGYGYVRDEKPTQVDWSKVSKNFSESLKQARYERERAARELGWSSAAEMDAARRRQMTKLRNERKMRALRYRIEKRKKKAELRRIKKENKLKRKNPNL